MKNLGYIFLIITLLTAFSCQKKTEMKSIKKIVIDSIKPVDTVIVKRDLNLDSILLNKVLDSAVIIAKKHLSKAKFSTKVELRYDSLTFIETEIAIGHFFSNQFTHVIIRRHGQNSVFNDVYLKSNNDLEKVLAHEEWNMTYVNDTLQDVNGDGYKDFLVNWYGSNGCCLKAFTNVFQYDPHNGKFIDDIEFINPTFSAKEKMVRGVEYGHPGETEMYKYHWNGFKIDTIEYISFDKNEKGDKTGLVIKAKHILNQNPKIIKLKSAPKEYKSIDGYSWFMGDL